MKPNMILHKLGYKSRDSHYDEYWLIYLHKASIISGLQAISNKSERLIEYVISDLEEYRNYFNYELDKKIAEAKKLLKAKGIDE